MISSPTPPRLPSQRDAYTLLELATVVAIIGLLIGGVMTGREVIQQSKIQRTVNSMSQIQQAVTGFVDQYNGYPGDLKNAATVLPAPAGGPAVINGNGNNTIEGNVACGFGGPSSPDCGDFVGERAQFFFHLSLTGLLPGFYDPTSTLPGVGYPSIPLHPNNGMFVSGAWPATANNGTNMVNFSQYAVDPMYLYLGVCNTAGLTDSSFNDCAVFTPEESSAIDRTLDDGNPLSGKLLAQSFGDAARNIFNTCAQGTAGATGTAQVSATSTPPLVNAYDLTSPIPGCNLLYSLKN